jgi:ABC-type sugar transport system substrate-binding protein
MTDFNADDADPIAEIDASLALSRRRFLASAGGAVAAAGLLGPAATSAFAATGAARRSDMYYSAKQIPIKDQVYYWITENVGVPFYVPGIAGMKAFGKVFGVQTQIIGPTNLDMSVSAQDMATILAKPNTAGIFSYFTDSNVNGPSYAAAYKAHVPIVNGAGDYGSPNVGNSIWDPNAIPTTAVDTIGKALNGTGSVGYIGILAGNAPLIAQEAEFESYLAKTYPKIKFAGKATYDGSLTDGLKKYAAFVGANNPDAMFWGDGNGPAIVDGLIAAAPKVKIMLMGISSQSLAAVKAKKVLGTVDRSTFDEEFWGFMPLYFAVNGRNRGVDNIYVNVVSITQANVDAFIANPYHSQVPWV